MNTKKIIKDIFFNTLQVKRNFSEGILLGAWIGIFSGFIWIIGSQLLKIKKIELGGSVLSPFIVWLFVSKNIRALGDFSDVFFVLSASSVSGLTSIIGSYLMDYNKRVTVIEILSGMGMGALIGGINIWFLINRGIKN